MAYRMSRLPSRFPVGTKFVIEGKGSGDDQVFTRYVEFPDGKIFRLPARSTSQQANSAKAGRSAKKAEPADRRRARGH